MMHYSSWLIGVKNRASLRNACKTPPNTDWNNNRGHALDTKNNNPQHKDKTCEQTVPNHLWKKGYKIIKKIGAGTFSEVVKTQSLKDGKFYACKTMKQTINSLEQANNLREVQAMKRLSPHANIIQLHELIFDKETGTVSLICELMEMNLYELIQGRQTPLPEQTVKHYMYQLCKSLEHMHSCGIFHRDVKPENILIRQNVLKLGDFGSCRSVYSKPPHTEYISTRWYRAPECLLTDGYYSLKMDIWSTGCVFFEIMSLNPLFSGANELDQIAKIHDVLGTPDQSILQKFKQSRAMHFNFLPRKGTGISRLIPNCPAPALSLLYQMLAYDPDERITAETAIRHTYFRDLRLAEKKADSLHRVTGAIGGVESSAMHSSMDHICRPTKLGKQLRGRHTRQTPLMSHTKHAAEPLIRRNIPHYPTELPKLNMVLPRPQIPFPVSTMPAFPATHRGTLPSITTKKCQSQLAKPRDESHRAAFKTFYMPPLDRKRGGY
ncbi:MAPK/MAK/MRK overlapping kinase isoform X1 [Solea senegalensis]|uniref:MAPK/MAK/MRK overlapping kinase isoform X1 n=1 Tax=Solea senegalensis TaxID=28829 RepID=A0AAV6RYQ0_SOLSE|nr:MAPK/MAK/MRK overlapping kinase-like isoform X1 [Solea senegalensis]KAG7509899.1 MAPK/MAK/MRK overlapping kinase isoform X1 [Solea senegalensis]